MESMDSNETRLLMRIVEMPICEDSSLPWNDQRNLMGRSPSETEHCSVTGWPDVMGSSFESNGTMRGTTTSSVPNKQSQRSTRNHKRSLASIL